MTSHRIFGRTAALLAALALGAGAMTSVAQGADTRAGSGPAHRIHVMPVRGSGVRTSASAPAPLAYGGGDAGVGVDTEPAKVYVIFWGSQWGTASTDSSGYTEFSGDPAGMAPRLQAMYRGLGTDGETWSGVLTQYCEGVAPGTTSCPASAAHVAFPAATGVLAGVWYDGSAASPANAGWSDLAAVATAGMSHFTDGSAGANRNAQYVVVSPTGTHPGGFNTSGGGFCAWHSGFHANGFDTAFTNAPYVPDMGGSCGAGYVNSGSAGALDGVTEVLGHEYAETLTDVDPDSGWTDSSGAETGDKCSWVGSGTTIDKYQDVTFATGSFAMQPTWANDAGGCEIAHPAVKPSPVSVTAPANQNGVIGTAASLRIAAADATGAGLSYAASGLPSGLSINATTGVISGTPTAYVKNGLVTITVTDTNHAVGTTAFLWTVVGTVTVTNPGSQYGYFGFPIVPVQIHATATDGGTIVYSASGLPPGLSISSGGLITGTPTQVGTYTVTVTASDNLSLVWSSTTFTWNVLL